MAKDALLAFSPGTPPFAPAKYPVMLYKITYTSFIPETHEKITATGLIAVPEVDQTQLPVLSYQHGTTFSKNEVPSNPDHSIETQLVLARFASNGSIVIAADYFGKGNSTTSDSYLVKGATQQACFDMLKASQAELKKLGKTQTQLRVLGWSQGAWATMVFLETLAENNIPVSNAIVAATPTDLYTCITRWINAPSEADSVYIPGFMALMLHSYEAYYGMDGLPKHAIRPEYLEVSKNLYLGEITWEEASKIIPKNLTDYLQTEFQAESNLGVTKFWQQLRKNQAFAWRNLTPLQIFYGTKDEIVPTYIGKLPIEYQKIINGAGYGEEVTNGTHRSTFIRALKN